ncbi:MAG: hypothetical protein ACOVNU_09925 [Candidatus Kapaibacteriota bacterium]
MNKIERAIYDTKLHLDNLVQNKIVLAAEISAFQKQLNALQSINENKSIPHIEVEPKSIKTSKTD